MGCRSVGVWGAGMGGTVHCWSQRAEQGWCMRMTLGRCGRGLQQGIFQESCRPGSDECPTELLREFGIGVRGCGPVTWEIIAC